MKVGFALGMAWIIGATALLGGCGGDDTTPQERGQVKVLLVELPDGRVVPCVESRTGLARGGVAISCDWATAHVAKVDGGAKVTK